ncbi:hypothetical protein OE88DRAFT_592650 [Heliocybe sulcata]|uniref:Uncharacterized protein n=1 Tax=Heliocybe sulcata TaxID=5364 RepID=A0A5C3N2L6_9AGAM|nr:hypothetical protein OE88DRAFT_592650 [Heliocybe sulcata]
MKADALRPRTFSLTPCWQASHLLEAVDWVEEAPWHADGRAATVLYLFSIKLTDGTRRHSQNSLWNVEGGRFSCHGTSFASPMKPTVLFLRLANSTIRAALSTVSINMQLRRQTKVLDTLRRPRARIIARFALPLLIDFVGFIVAHPEVNTRLRTPDQPTLFLHFHCTAAVPFRLCLFLG